LAGHFVLPLLAFHFIDGKFAIGIQSLVDADIPLQLLVSPNELQYLVYDLVYLILDLVKDPVVVAAVGEHTGILEIDDMPRCLGLSEFKDSFQVGNAHLAIFKNKIQDPQARFIGTRFEDLRSQYKVEVL